MSGGTRRITYFSDLFTVTLKEVDNAFPYLYPASKRLEQTTRATTE
jgi:hypothetical protein